MKKILDLTYQDLIEWSLKTKSKEDIICNIPSGFGKTFTLGKIIMEAKESMNIIYINNGCSRKDIDFNNINLTFKPKSELRELIDKIHYIQNNFYNYSDFSIIEEYKDDVIVIKNKNIKIRIVSLKALELEQYKKLEYELIMFDDCLPHTLPINIKFNRKISMITMNDYNKTLKKLFPNSLVLESDINSKTFDKFINNDFREFIDGFKIQNSEVYYNYYAILSLPDYYG